MNLDTPVKTAAARRGAETLDAWLPGALSGYGAAFVAAGIEFSVNSDLLAAIAVHETGGKSRALRVQNNAMGSSFPKRKDGYFTRSFPSVEYSIRYQAAKLGGIDLETGEKFTAYNGAETIRQLARIYAPAGARNDPRKKNGYWPNGVADLLASLLAAPAPRSETTTLSETSDLTDAEQEENIIETGGDYYIGPEKIVSSNASPSTLALILAHILDKETRPAPVSLPSQEPNVLRPRIAVIIGHNAAVRGAYAPAPVSAYEYDYNTRVADEMLPLFEAAGIDGKIYRRRPHPDGYSGEIDSVYDEVNADMPSAYLELHFNKYKKRRVSGAETLSSGTDESLRLAAHIQREIVRALRNPDRGVKVEKGKNGWRSLRAGEAPGVIPEPCFVSNCRDCARLHKLGPSGLAAVYVRGITAFLKKT